jgi:sec-independent protein translocase protein TatB
MFGMGWSEIVLISIVALIVVGPKDLPVLFRKVGQFAGKAKGMAREFSRAMNEAADDAGVSDISKTLRAATNPVQTGLDSVKKAATDFTKYDASSATGKLAEDRAEAAKKINEAAAKRASDRIAAEKAAEAKAAADAQAAKPEPEPAKDSE